MKKLLFEGNDAELQKNHKKETLSKQARTGKVCEGHWMSKGTWESFNHRTPSANVSILFVYRLIGSELYIISRESLKRTYKLHFWCRWIELRVSRVRGNLVVEEYYQEFYNLINWDINKRAKLW